jgi:dTDP-4-dehydrorhamnose reductase
MPRVLVIGASGLLGSRVAREFLEANFEVHGTSRTKQVPIGCAPIKFQFSSNLEAKSVFPLDFDVIVNCAGLTNVDVCESRPEAAWQLNASIPFWLSNFAIQAGAHFIHISTDHFKSLEDLPRDELTPMYPVNTYGYSKIGGERFIGQSNSNTTILRTNFFGLSESRNHSLLDFFVKKITTGESLIGFADVLFSPIGASELAKIIVEISQKKITGLFNAAGMESLTKYEFALRVAEKLGMSSQLINYGLARDAGFKSHRPNYLVLDSRKLTDTLQRSTLSLDEMLYYELTNTLGA